MQFHLPLGLQRIDLDAIERQLQLQDPAAIADVDATRGTLRVSTSLDARQLAKSLGHAGLAVDARHIEQQPSTCCGGCGG